MTKPVYYNFFWRWHFYAGLIVMPVVLVMAITGAIYLLQPQIENLAYKDLLYLEENIQKNPDHDAMVDAAKKHFNAKSVNSYQPPAALNQSAQVVLTSQNGTKITAFIHPETLAPLGTINESWRLMNIARNLHKNLMLGDVGRIITELTACWLIVMILTGIYLWWPRGNKDRGVLIPNTKNKGRKIWREFHAVSGAWVSVWLLLLLLSGLPWSFVCGGLLSDFSTRAKEGFPKAIFKERPMSKSSVDLPEVSMNQILQTISKQNVNHAFKIEYPWWEKGSYALMPLRHGGDAKNVAYIFFDRKSGEILDQYRFDDLGKVGRLTSLGVAFHEGRLFGKANQLLNLTAIFLLLILMITGFAMWLKRKPHKSLGAPSLPDNVKLPKQIIALIILTGLLLPLFGISVFLIWIGEKILKKIR
jgi:uncharacterized iron-regulated membrane protein